MSVNPTTPTPEDLIALSSYLDDELSGSEREALEQRLSTDEGLRNELESLRETVELVRSLPHLKAPRNFTLDPTVYGADSQPNNVTFLSRKTIWRLGAVASIAATFALVFAVFLMGGDDANQPTSEKLDESISMANDSVGSSENFDQTTVAQTAFFVQATQVALSSTDVAPDETTRGYDSTELAIDQDQTTKATAALAPTWTLSQTPVSSEGGGEPVFATGADETNQNVTPPPVATRTLIASFDTTPTSVGIIGATATQLSRDTTLPNTGGGNAQDGQQGVGGQSGETTSDAEEESATAPSFPTWTSSPAPTASPTQTTSPVATTTPMPQPLDDVAPNVAATMQGTPQPESATDTMSDTADTSSMAAEAADESDVYSDDAGDADAPLGEEDRNTDMAAPPSAPNPEYSIGLLRELIDFIIERFLDMMSLFSR